MRVLRTAAETALGYCGGRCVLWVPWHGRKRVVLVIAALLVCQMALEAQGAVKLGRFTLGSLQGSVELNIGTSLYVIVAIEGAPNVRAEEFQVWLLMKDGTAALLRERSPKPGQQPLSARVAGIVSLIEFRFDKVDPVAVVLSRGGEFSIYSVPAAQSGQLSGTVRDTGGGELPGVTVTANSRQLSQARTATTDGRARFAFADLPPGDYMVTFSLDPFEDCSDGVSITADERTITEVVMRIRSIPPRAGIQTCGRQAKTNGGFPLQ